MSSFTESRYALESGEPRRIRFDLERVLRTEYRVNFLQQLYFVIDDFRNLRDLVLKTDLPGLYAAMAGSEVLRPTDMLPEDQILG